MKEMMDQGTILFKSDTQCIAFNLKYLNENFNIISPTLKNITEIYAKPRRDRDSWFDFKKLLLDEDISYYKNKSYKKDPKTGKNIEIIEKHKYPYEYLIQHKSQIYKLSKTLNEIPECEYTDSKGYIHKISGRDGLDGNINERRVYSEYGKVESILKGSSDRVVVKFFNSDVSNSIITVNGLFFDNYEINTVSDEYYNEYSNVKKATRIIYKISDLLRDDEVAIATGLSKTDLLNYMKENYTFKLFKWDNVRVSKEEKAIEKKDSWFRFEKPIDSGCLVFYNKVLHFYEVNKYDPHYIRIAEDTSVINEYGKYNDDISIVRLTQPVKDSKSSLIKFMPVKQELFVGYMDRDTYIVRFPKRMSNSLVTYNGVYFKYHTDISGYNLEFEVSNAKEHLQGHNLMYNGYDGKAGLPETKYSAIQKLQKKYLDKKNELDFKGMADRMKEQSFYMAFVEGVPIYAVNIYNYNAPEVEELDINKNLMRNMDIIVNHYIRELEMSRRRVHELETATRYIYDDYVDEIMLVPNKDNVFTLKYPAVRDTLRLYINGVLYTEKIHYITKEHSNTERVKSIEWTFTGTDGFDLTQITVDSDKLSDIINQTDEQAKIKREKGIKYKVIAVYDMDYKDVEYEVKQGKGREKYLALSEEQRKDKNEILKIFKEIENQLQYNI